MALAQAGGGLDPLVGARRRHADVGEHDVGPVALDGLEQFGEVGAGGDDLDAVLDLQEADDAFAHQQRVFGHDYPDGHRRRGYRPAAARPATGPLPADPAAAPGPAQVTSAKRASARSSGSSTTPNSTTTAASHSGRTTALTAIGASRPEPCTAMRTNSMA